MSKLQMKLNKNPFPKVRVKGRNTNHTLNLLYFDWPVTRVVLNKLVAFLAIVLPSKEAELAAQRIVESALKAYSESVYHLNIHKTPDPERIHFFVKAVINKTTDILQEKGVAVHDAENLSLALYELFTSEQLKTVLKEKMNEKAIVGRIVSSDDTNSSHSNFGS